MAKISKEELDILRRVGQKMGKKYGAQGGKKTAAQMTPAERTARAKKAAAASAKVRSAKARKKG